MYLNEINVITELSPTSKAILKDWEVESYELFKNFTLMFDDTDFDLFYVSNVPK